MNQSFLLSFSLFWSNTFFLQSQLALDVLKKIFSEKINFPDFFFNYNEQMFFIEFTVAFF